MRNWFIYDFARILLVAIIGVYVGVQVGFQDATKNWTYVPCPGEVQP